VFRKCPDPAGPHTVPGMNAEIFIVMKFQFRAPDPPWVLEVRLITSSLRAVEADLCMRSVTERFVLRVATPAESITFLHGILFGFAPGLTIPLIVVADLLLNERNTPAHDIGAVFTDGDLHSNLPIFHGSICSRVRSSPYYHGL
jgi:hypothetical protein